MGRRAADGTGQGRRAAGLFPRRLLAADGHAARQEPARKPVAERHPALEDLVMTMTNEFWRGKRVLVTGHTGFKGSWLTLVAARARRRCVGPVAGAADRAVAAPAARRRHGRAGHRRYPRPRCGAPHHVLKTKPQIVFHLAAQALVRAGYRDPVETFDVNVMGTVNLLDALRVSQDVRSIVVVTTDKVYHNAETGLAFMRERSARRPRSLQRQQGGGRDRRGELSRLVLRSRAGIGLATARAGNVIGGGDWAEDRLIPDAVRAWQSGETLAGAPPARRAPLAARARAAWRLYGAGRSVCGTTPDGDRELQFRTGSRRGGVGRRRPEDGRAAFRRRRDGAGRWQRTGRTRRAIWCSTAPRRAPNSASAALARWRKPSSGRWSGIGRKGDGQAGARSVPCAISAISPALAAEDEPLRAAG